MYRRLKLRDETKIASRYVNELRIQTPSIDRAVRYLSGGNQQKVVLARWLFSEANILIFDEPTRGIDVGTKSEVFALINNLVRRGVGILMISSEMPEILAIADRILVLKSTTSEHIKSNQTTNTLRSLVFRGGPLIALILLSAYLAIATPYFFTTSNLTNVVRQSSITAILAVGQTLVIIIAGIDLSVGAIAALSASFAAVLMTQQVQIGDLSLGPISFGMGVIVALIVGILCGALNGLIINKGRIPDFIATLGTLTIFRGIALLITGGLPVPSHITATELKGYLPEQMIWMGNGSIMGVPVSGLIALIIVFIGWFILRYTALGRSIYAVGGNREAARVSGINIDRTKLIVYTICGLMCAIGGIVLAGRLNSANALMAEGANLNSIAAVIIGGTNLFGGEGGVIGSLIGALIMGVLGNGMNLLNVSAFWQRVIQGAVIILVVVFDQWRRRRFAV
jgi:ribose transport system permease protein